MASFVNFSLFILFSATIAAARDPHVIKFKSPDLYPESVSWDPTAQHFIVGSLRHRSFHSITDAGVVSTLISDPSLPPNSTILGLAVDNIRRRLLAAITSLDNPPFNALAAYDLRSLTPLFLTRLPPSDGPAASRDVANDVAIDFDGNAYVTNSGNNFIWKVNSAGESSIFSRSPIFTETEPVDPKSPYASCGLNGIHYVSKGYLLVVQSNTGKLFKVDAVDGTARRVLLKSDLYLADGIALRKDGAAVAVSPVTGVISIVKSDDSFSEGTVAEKIEVNKEGFPTAVVVGGGERVYLLYGHVEEGIKGNSGREWFRIEEVREGSEGEIVWVFVLIGLGLVYFLVWRFQMRQLVTNMDRKIQ
ncbi:hypothetical protein V2J09_020593 [Rumex salicifolius]